MLHRTKIWIFKPANTALVVTILVVSATQAATWTKMDIILKNEAYLCKKAVPLSYKQIVYV